MTIRDLLWRGIRSLLFRLEAERAHHLATFGMRVARAFGKAPLRWVSGSSPVQMALPDPALEVFGIGFRNRVGLAAGFDKNAEMVPCWPELGFGFCEVGTVTPLPQPGNERPRLFRDPACASLFNRMGFNNAGAAAAARRLETVRGRLPGDFRVGVNVGKNKDTPLDQAHEDYRRAAVPFEGLVDYLVINVSSPNTPGLRSLQSVDFLKPIVQETLAAVSKWKRPVPVLLKLAPELGGESFESLILEAERWGIGGWVLTNTLAGEWTLPDGRKLPGGWSDGKVREESMKSLAFARSRTRLPIISVGGIDSIDEAKARRAAGADLVQVYSAFVYEGPAFPGKIARNC